MGIRGLRLARLIGVPACAALTVLNAPAWALDAEADVEVGAFLGYSLHHADGDDGLGTENNSSRWHLGGTLQTEGLEVFGYYERGIAVDEDDAEPNREAFGGVAGRYGRLTVGRQSTGYKRAGVALDPFYDTTRSGAAGRLSGAGPSYGLSALTDGSAPGTVSYESPVFSGLQVSAASYVDDGEAQDHDYGVGARYVTGDARLSAGLQYLDLSGGVVPGAGGTGSALRVYGGWDGGRWSLGGSGEYLDLDGRAEAERYYYIATSYALRERLRLAASFGRTDETIATGKAASLGAFYRPLDQVVLYAAANRLWLDDDERLSFALGGSFSFSRVF